MLAIAIIRHSLRLLSGNWRAALKISIIPFAIMAVGTTLQLEMLGKIGTAAASPDNQVIRGTFIQMMITGLIIYLGALWAAVSWHRYVLLEEPASVFPPLRAGRLLSYFGHSLLVSLILLGVAMPILLIIGILFNQIGVGTFSNGLITLIVGLPLVSVGLRLSTGLPGAALGQARPISTAWQATKGQMGCFVALALIGLAAQLALSHVTAALVSPIFTDAQLIKLLPALLIDWMSVLVAVSVLTTTHGHFVQGRTLV